MVAVYVLLVLIKRIVVLPVPRVGGASSCPRQKVSAPAVVPGRDVAVAQGAVVGQRERLGSCDTCGKCS